MTQKPSCNIQRVEAHLNWNNVTFLDRAKASCEGIGVSGYTIVSLQLCVTLGSACRPRVANEIVTWSHSEEFPATQSLGPLESIANDAQDRHVDVAVVHVALALARGDFSEVGNMTPLQVIESGTERWPPCVGSSASLPARPALKTHTHNSWRHMATLAQAKQNKKSETKEVPLINPFNSLFLVLILTCFVADGAMARSCSVTFFAGHWVKAVRFKDTTARIAPVLLHFPSGFVLLSFTPPPLLRADHGSLALSLLDSRKNESNEPNQEKNTIPRWDTSKSEINKGKCFNMFQHGLQVEYGGENHWLPTRLDKAVEHLQNPTGLDPSDTLLTHCWLPETHIS